MKTLLALAAVATILALAATLVFGLRSEDPDELRAVRLELPAGVLPGELLFRDPEGRSWRTRADGMLCVPRSLDGCHLLPEIEKTGRTFDEVLLDLGDVTRLPTVRVQ